ncbi:rhodanese-like domain-containing protein [Kitasatospora sp. DSM 101779]|uniref:rhodanese-like domain-containing protein n=1 Tax=Kitasatospora sp. DSM 101779 TaxID=2853165 RepID=UPI0021D9590E|nr:rhodanese-like domain-containing protein [Kitasatospora sp. DSM 101779]MCU7821926.1 rhodanese-like domain-containing protein [Kitasatospora sp. DSM 101779]
MVTTVDEPVAGARAGVHRPGPGEAFAAVAEGAALLVDIRPVAQRARERGIPGAPVIERNVLERRLDPAGSHRIPEAPDHGVHWIAVCSEGHASGLAAASLRELGPHRAADPDGGHVAWAAAGLPTLSADGGLA